MIATPLAVAGRGSSVLKLRLGSRLTKRGAIVRRIAVLQHPFENLMRVSFRAIGPQSRFVIHPGEYDGFHGRVITEEQAKAGITELRPEPVLVLLARRRALPIDGSGRIGRDCLEHPLVQSRQ